MQHWREGLRDDWENGLLIEDTEFKGAIAQAKSLGNLQTIKRILDLDHETLETELEDVDN